MTEQNTQQVVTWEGIVEQVGPKFNEIASQGKLVRWAEESQFAIQSIYKNDQLTKCAPHTIQNAIINVAAVGLTLNPADGYAYLVPEWDRSLKGNACQLRVSFKGLIKIATDSRAIKWVKAEIVRQADQFLYKGVGNLPEHSMNPFQDRGSVVGVYCVAKTHEGDYLTDVMSLEEIQKIQACAKTQMVWQNWFEEMAKKAIIKRAAKQWPKTGETSRLNNAISIINESEGSDFDPIEKVRETCEQIIDLIAKGDEMGVGQLYCELTEEEQSAAWTAKTKGGFFTQDEKVFIRNAQIAYVNANMSE